MSDSVFFYSSEIIESQIESHKRNYNIDISAHFIKCADTQLRIDFEKKTGLKINKRIQLSAGPTYEYAGARVEVKVKEGESRILYSIWISNNSNPITIAWKSKSGRVYTMGDADLDCNDIIFWFEGLDPLLYHKQLYPKDTSPFKLKNLTYELIVTRLNLDCDIEIYLKNDRIGDAEKITLDIDHFIHVFNEKSEKAKIFRGVVHNWKRGLKNNDVIEYNFDLGSAEFIFFKHLLKYLSDLECFYKIEIL